MTETAEFAFDSKRVRYSSHAHDSWRILNVWDGQKYIAHEQYSHNTPEEVRTQEGFAFYKTHESKFIDVFGNFNWPSAGPHFFWWDKFLSVESRQSWVEQFGKQRRALQ